MNLGQFIIFRDFILSFSLSAHVFCPNKSNDKKNVKQQHLQGNSIVIIVFPFTYYAFNILINHYEVF